MYKFDWITGDWTFRKQAIKYHILKEELALATGLHLLAENGQPKVSDKLTTKPGVSHDKFESYLEHAEKIALSLPDISQQTVSIPRGVDPDLVLFHIVNIFVPKYIVNIDYDCNNKRQRGIASEHAKTDCYT